MLQKPVLIIVTANLHIGYCDNSDFDHNNQYVGLQAGIKLFIGIVRVKTAITLGVISMLNFLYSEAKVA